VPDIEDPAIGAHDGKVRHNPVGDNIVVRNALCRYETHIRAVLESLGTQTEPSQRFEAAYALPAPSAQLAEFFDVSDIAVTDLAGYAGRTLRLLDLMRNPRTRTTKTFASRLIVARAVEHIHRTGERVMIVSPSSGNKAVALRDAVLAAHETGLATADQLAILVVVPATSRGKLWSSPLSTDRDARRRNPVAVHDGARPEQVKALAGELVDRAGPAMYERFGVRLWHTLALDNYRVADSARAYVEHDCLPAAEVRLHVHAVSSAFGLLGHDLGARRLAAGGHRTTAARYFLVQHLNTPDMVLSLYFGSTARESLPGYAFDPAAGLYRQDADPRFPMTTTDPDETLDPTFYTRQPITSTEMNALIHSQGGGGIVVSRHECVQRYPLLRRMLEPTGCVLPPDPADLREWSLVMALTGVLNGIDRGLVPEEDILVHGSGSYQVADFDPIPDPDLVHDAADLAELAAGAAGIRAASR
jgi:hypothetical protein